MTLDISASLDSDLYSTLGKCLIEFGRIEYLLDHITNHRFGSETLSEIGKCKKRMEGYQKELNKKCTSQSASASDAGNLLQRVVDLNTQWNDWKHAAYAHKNGRPIRKRKAKEYPITINDLKGILTQAEELREKLVLFGPEGYSHTLGAVEVSAG